jgi:hypothetical protein
MISEFSPAPLYVTVADALVMFQTRVLATVMLSLSTLRLPAITTSPPDWVLFVPPEVYTLP